MIELKDALEKTAAIENALDRQQRQGLTDRQTLIRDFLLRFVDNSGTFEMKLQSAIKHADAILQSGQNRKVVR